MLPPVAPSSDAAVSANPPPTPAATSAKAQLDTQLAAAKNAKPAYPDLSGKVADLEQQLAKARQPVAPAYPDLRARVSELETGLAAATSEANRAKQESAALASAKADAKF